MAELSLDPEEYARTRGHFRDTATRLALFREALIEHGFTDEQAGQFCLLWLHSALELDDEEDAG